MNRGERIEDRGQGSGAWDQAACAPEPHKRGNAANVTPPAVISQTSLDLINVLTDRGHMLPGVNDRSRFHSQILSVSDRR